MVDEKYKAFSKTLGMAVTKPKELGAVTSVCRQNWVY